MHEVDTPVRRATLALAVLLLAVPAQSQETCPCPPPEPPAPPKPVWTGSIGFSYLASKGNTNSESGGLTADLNRRPKPWGLDFDLNAKRVEEEGETTTERFYAGLRGERSVGERFEVFGGLVWERDVFSGLESRYLIETGWTWLTLRGPVLELDFDLGVTYADEDPTVGPGTDPIGGVAGLDFVWNMSESATFREELVVHPSFEDGEDWRMRTKTTLETSLIGSWAFRVTYLFERDNLPVEGFEPEDVTLSASLVWKR